MPQDSILHQLPSAESLHNSISVSTVLRLEHLYGVSRVAMLYRLKAIGLIDEKKLQELLKVPAIETAREHGYDTSLYKSANDGLVIGNFGSLARQLFEKGKISEGHYEELLNMIS